MLARRNFLKSATSAIAVSSIGSRVSAQTSEFKGLMLSNDGLGLAALVKAGDVTPLELAEGAVEAAWALDGKLNAITTPMYEQALAKAAVM